jgi:hypothetical protein
MTIGPAPESTNLSSAYRDRKMSELSLMKVTRVEPLGGYRLRFHFSDGTIGERDFSDLLDQTAPMIEPLKDSEYFRRVFVEFGTPTWPNGFDLAPWALHSELAAAGSLRLVQTA